MFEDMLKAEAWRRKLELNGYRIVTEPYEKPDADKTGQYKKITECQACGTMTTTPTSTGLCPHCAGG